MRRSRKIQGSKPACAFVVVPEAGAHDPGDAVRSATLCLDNCCYFRRTKRMKSFMWLAIAVVFAASPLLAQKPKRINRAIELLEAGQPVYYTGGRGGYEEGRKMAATRADYINYEMEHGAFNMKELRDFMRGLVDAGPTRTGHRTPAVIVTLPILCKDAAAMRANYWLAQQVMAAGVHGILLCHAENPEAVKIFVESLRYPFAEKHAGLDTGIRGSGSQTFAAQIWGLPANEYMLKADRSEE